MANIYVARHEMLDRMLAVKVLKRDLPPTSRAAERFRREAKSTSRIEQENVVYLTDFGVTDDGLQYMVMEYVAGPQLGTVVKDAGGLPWRRAASLGLQLARALQAAHTLGIIHRDLKPENLLVVDPGGRDLLKVLDFGIAKMIASESADEVQLTRAGMVFGTPEYMSPEHAQGLLLDGRSDLYALGLILWECLVGRRPIQGRSAPETLALQLSRKPAAPSTQLAGGSIPKALDDIVLAMVAKDPEERPANAGVVIRALEVLLREQARADMEAEADAAKPAAPPAARAPTPAATILDANLADELRRHGVTIEGRDPATAMEQLILDLAEALWPPDARPNEVTRTLASLEEWRDRQIEVETDLALVDDEIGRINTAARRHADALAATGAPTDEVARVDADAERAVMELDIRADDLRARAAAHAKASDEALGSLAMLVMFGRDRAPDLAGRYAELERLNREVALTRRLPDSDQSK